MRRESWVMLVLILITVVLAARLFLFIDQYATVLPAFDRWRILDPVFYDMSWWEGFSYQHGVHRVGVIYFISDFLAEISEWNSRYEMFFQGGIYLLTSGMALMLKRRLFGRFSWGDLIIPAIFLTIHSATTITTGPFVHGLIPFFAIWLGLLYSGKNSIFSTLLKSLIIFAATFTGFGFVLVPAMAATELYFIVFDKKVKLSRHLIPMLVAIGSFIFLLISNVPNEAWDEQTFRIIPFLEYLILISNNIFLQGTTGRAIAMGLVLLVLLGILALKLWKRRSTNPSLVAVVILLVGSSLTFAVLNTLGRYYFGLDNALASRYIPVGMNIALGFYFLAKHYQREKKMLGTLVQILLLVLIFRVQLRTVYLLNVTQKISTNLVEMEECLKKGITPDYNACEHELSRGELPLHPHAERVNIQQKVEFFKENKLNIYND